MHFVLEQKSVGIQVPHALQSNSQNNPRVQEYLRCVGVMPAHQLASLLDAGTNPLETVHVVLHALKHLWKVQ